MTADPHRVPVGRCLAVSAAVLLFSACPWPSTPDDRVSVGPDGGRVVSADGVAVLEVPPGGVREPVTMRLRVVADAPMGAVGSAYAVEPAAQVFERPARLAISYRPADLGPRRAADLKVDWLDGQQWRGLGPTLVDESAASAAALISRARTYGLGFSSAPLSCTAAADGYCQSSGCSVTCTDPAAPVARCRSAALAPDPNGGAVLCVAPPTCTCELPVCTVAASTACQASGCQARCSGEAPVPLCIPAAVSPAPVAGQPDQCVEPPTCRCASVADAADAGWSAPPRVPDAGR